MQWTLLGLTAILSATLALPGGPPLEACEHMEPGTRMGEIGLEGHTTLPQNVNPTYGNSKTPPYYFLMSPSAREYTPGQEYSIYVIANQTNSHNFYKGIILQARRVICASNTTVEAEEEPFGTFVVGTSNATLLTTMDCTHTASTISHRSPQVKINETAKWRAPDTYVGHLVFKATIVKTTTIYWTDAYSPVMLDPTSEMHPTCKGCTSASLSILLMIAAFLIQRITRF